MLEIETEGHVLYTVHPHAVPNPCWPGIETIIKSIQFRETVYTYLCDNNVHLILAVLSVLQQKKVITDFDLEMLDMGKLSCI